jgi:hypothetical protein
MLDSRSQQENLASFNNTEGLVTLRLMQILASPRSLPTTESPRRIWQESEVGAGISLFHLNSFYFHTTSGWARAGAQLTRAHKASLVSRLSSLSKTQSIANINNR